MVLLEELRQKRFVTVKQVASVYALSVKFLEQVAGKLRKAGFVKGSRGRDGGYQLVRQSVFLNDLSAALGSTQPAVSCKLSDDCRGGAMCVEREIEAKMIGEMNDSFAQMAVTR